MYCPNCGGEFTNGLKYCKRCGANLSQSASAPLSGSDIGTFASMFWAIAVYGFVSLAVLIGGVIALVALNVRAAIVGPLSGMALLLIFAIAFILSRQLSRIISATSAPQLQSQTGRLDHAQGERSFPELAEPPRAVSSVTEHTTRNMEPSKYRDRSVRE